MKLREGQKWAIAQNDIKAIDWKDCTVTVAKKGDRVKILQEFPDMTFIEVEDWQCEVVVNPNEIEEEL